MVEWVNSLKDEESKLRKLLEAQASSTRWSGAKSRKELEDLIKLSEKVAIRDLFSDTEQETLLNFFKFAVEDKGFDAETLAQINASLKKLGLPGVTENGYSKAVADFKFITETAKSQVDAAVESGQG